MDWGGVAMIWYGNEGGKGGQICHPFIHEMKWYGIKVCFYVEEKKENDHGLYDLRCIKTFCFLGRKYGQG